MVTIGEALSLPAGGEQELQSAKAAVAKQVQHPSIQQYAVVVWDHDRKNIYDIAFSPEAFIQPPGVSRAKTISLTIRLSEPGRRQRYQLSALLSSRPRFAAIHIDRAHTMFPSGSEVTLRFSVRNPTDQPWRGVTIRARLFDPEGKELAARQVAAGVNLDPRGSPLAEETKFTLPPVKTGFSGHRRR